MKTVVCYNRMMPRSLTKPLNVSGEHGVNHGPYPARQNVPASGRRAGRWTLLPWLLLGLLATAGPLSASIALTRGIFAHPNILIVYDSWHQLPNPSKADIEAPNSSLADALQLEQLLGHFPFTAQLLCLTDYHPGIMVGYQYVFFIGNVKKAVLPPAFLRDVYHYRGSLYWINYGLGQIAPIVSQRTGGRVFSGWNWRRVSPKCITMASNWKKAIRRRISSR